MSTINGKLGLKPAGTRSMMKLPEDRALRNRVTSAQCPNPTCGQRRAHLSRSKPGWVVCEWCGETWELPKGPNGE